MIRLRNEVGQQLIEPGRPILANRMNHISFDLQKDERIQLRHRFVFHAGDAETAKIAEAFDVYAKESR